MCIRDRSIGGRRNLPDAPALAQQVKTDRLNSALYFHDDPPLPGHSPREPGPARAAPENRTPRLQRVQAGRWSRANPEPDQPATGSRHLVCLDAGATERTVSYTHLRAHETPEHL